MRSEAFKNDLCVELDISFNPNQKKKKMFEIEPTQSLTPWDRGLAKMAFLYRFGYFVHSYHKIFQVNWPLAPPLKSFMYRSGSFIK